MLPIDTHKINPLKLPSLPLNWRKGFSKCPAIYFALKGNKVLYIGRSGNLARRWAGHHRLAELEVIGEVRIAWLEVSEPTLLPAIEEALIRHFKPTLNSQIVRVVKKCKLKGNHGNPQEFLTFNGEKSHAIPKVSVVDESPTGSLLQNSLPLTQVYGRLLLC